MHYAQSFYIQSLFHVFIDLINTGDDHVPGILLGVASALVSKTRNESHPLSSQSGEGDRANDPVTEKEREPGWVWE